MKILVYVLNIFVGLSFNIGTVLIAGAGTQLDRGKYLAIIMDFGGCDTTCSFIGKPDSAKYLAGSDQSWALPDGVYWLANITSDQATGVGEWSKDDIVKLQRTGVDPKGREVAPIMPWRAYSALSDGDMEAVATFIKSVPAVDHAVLGPKAPRDVKTPVLTLTVLPNS